MKKRKVAKQKRAKPNGGQPQMERTRAAVAILNATRNDPVAELMAFMSIIEGRDIDVVEARRMLGK